MVTFVKGRETKAQMVHRPGPPAAEEGEWIATTCRMCLVSCGVLVHKKHGEIINVIGNPDSPHNRGRMCAKGKSAIMTHYNPTRVLSPLKRTNPEKGIDVDPMWERISWDEALDTVCTKLQEVYDKDPRKLYLQTWNPGGGGSGLSKWLSWLRPAFGTPHVQGGLSSTCGKTIHPVQYMVSGGFHEEPDFDNCNYLILVGTQMGIAAREGFNHEVADCATARERGMKLVVVDPVGNNAASKADEWLPIRPGTDAAWGMSMLHVLLNEEKIYDAEFLKNRTNACYLVGASKLYARDPSTEKALLYDLSDGKIKTYDDPTLDNPALEGEYEVQGEKVRPAFELLKERVAEYPPEVSEPITTIPAKTLRRIAREFGKAAQIGATVQVDGVTLPYRPVALSWCRGPQGHAHAWLHSWAIQLVPMVVGALQVPGSNHCTWGPSRYPEDAWPAAGEDGMLTYSGAIGYGHFGRRSGHPGRKATKPSRADLYELFPVANHTKTVVPITFKESEKYGIEPKAVEMVIHTPANELAGGFGDVKQAAEWYKSMDFILGFAIELNETHGFDDIVFPCATNLEFGSFGDMGAHPDPAVAGENVGFYQIQQKVIDPPEGVRPFEEVMTDIYERLGILDDVYLTANRTLALKEPYLLEPGQRYTADEIDDRHAKSRFGEEHGWDWFKKNGVLVWERNVEERYPGPFIPARVPIYLEHFIQRGSELKELLDEMELSWDLSDYDALPQWKPCHAYERLAQGEIDAIGVHYKLAYVYGAHGQANPWIDELCDKIPHSYGVLINTKMAHQKGIQDGDTIWLETPVKKVKAVARVTECVHPEVIAIAAHSGHWANGKRVSKDKGVNFNGLLVSDLAHLDTISTSLDHCAELKISRA